VFVIAGQHGDEARAMEAARNLEAPGVQLAVVAAANPDGAAAESRLTASGLDMNRDHLLLETPEAQAVHAFARQFGPDRVVDVHNFPRRRIHLVKRGLRYAQQVFVDGPTHPEVARLSEADTVIEGLRRAGFRADRYLMVTPTGKARHGTPDPRDLRNAMALRLGVPTLLIEGRSGSTRGRETRARQALAAGLELAVTAPPAPRRSPAKEVWISGKYEYSSDPAVLDMRTVDGIRPIELTPYRHQVRPTRRVPLFVYAVPCSPLWDVLDRHGFTWTDVGQADVEVLRIESFDPSKKVWRAPRRVRLVKRRERRSLAGYRVYQPHPFLAVLLEPLSKWGLIRWPEALLARLGDYPVLRVDG
jgi:hypothetical protein